MLETEEFKLRTELDSEFIEAIGNFAGSFYARKGLRGFAIWSVEDLIHEMVVSLKRKIDQGTLYERVNRKYLNERAIDAIRVLEKGNPKFQGRQAERRARKLVYSDDVASYIDLRRSTNSKRETGEGIISFSEALEQDKKPETPAEHLRRKFEDEGCLWTRVFHEHLEKHIDDMAKESASKLRKRSRNGSASERVIQLWIEENPGANPTARWLATHLGMERETVTRKVRALIEQAKILRRPAAYRGKVGECKTRGQWAYYPAGALAEDLATGVKSETAPKAAVVCNLRDHRRDVGE
jgi:hypothetical protein